MTATEINTVLETIVKRITSHTRAERIILFGSWARDTAGPDSDLDLLVVMDVAGSKRQQANQVDLLLEGIPLPTDVIVATPQEFEKYRDCPGTVIREAAREGKVLYERAA